jgi:aryl carrier-like protein
MEMDARSIDLSAEIGKVMGEVLVRDPLARDEDFFDCGGDSLRAIEVLQRLADRPELASWLGTTEMQALLLESIFEDASPAGLASVAVAQV